MPGVDLTAHELIQLRSQALVSGLAPRRRILTHQAGAYLSAFKGRGMDFEETRAYQPGDDVRNIDWRVTARTGQAHTKVFREERERPVFCVVDLGPSMRFATRVAFKSVIAARAAALLAWACVGHGDRVGGILFAGGTHRELRPASRDRGVLLLINELCKLHRQTPEADLVGKDLERATKRLQRLARPGSLLVFLSDFYALSDEVAHALSRLAQHSDVMLGMVSDPLERQAPPPGRYRISDGRREAELDTRNPRLIRRYNQPYQSRLERLRELRGQGVHLVMLSTDRPVAESLRQGLRERHGLYLSKST